MQQRTVLDKAYFAGVVIKGIDGLIELLAGLILLAVPSVAHTVIQHVIHESSEGHGLVAQWLTRYASQLDADLVKGGTFVVIAFLITHGAVKLVLVYCLLKKILWAYPYALVVLGLLWVYQLYILVRHPTFGVTFLVLLDVAIIWLVWREYRVLRAEK